MTDAAAPDTAGQRERLGWDQFGEAARDLARAMLRDGFEPDVVVPIARGVLLPAGAPTCGEGT